MINDRVRKAQTPPRPVAARRLAAWREASSRVASPPPQLEWPSFQRDGNCEALGPTADYDGTLGSFADVAPTRAGDIFRFATSRRTVLPARPRTHRTAISGAPLASPLRAPNVPRSCGRARRGTSTVACSSARPAGNPVYSRATGAKNAITRAARTAGGSSLAGFRLPRMRRVLRLRFRVSRRFRTLGRREESATSTALSLQAFLSDSKVLRRSLLVPSPQCSRSPRFDSRAPARRSPPSHLRAAVGACFSVQRAVHDADAVKTSRRPTFPCAPKSLLICDPTLRQTKPREDPRPQCAFKESVLSVSCNSHQVSQLAAFFIDPRTE